MDLRDFELRNLDDILRYKAREGLFWLQHGKELSRREKGKKAAIETEKRNKLAPRDLNRRLQMPEARYSGSHFRKAKITGYELLSNEDAAKAKIRDAAKRKAYYKEHKVGTYRPPSKKQDFFGKEKQRDTQRVPLPPKYIRRPAQRRTIKA